MKWIIVTLFALMMACIATADEFDDRVAKFAAETAKRKAAKCVCEGEPSLCTCDVCTCAGGSSCRVAKPKVEPVAAPKETFKHDCGCPLLQCNCGSAGCHCSENRADNRQPLRWVPDGGRWYLYRGSQCVGTVNGRGSFYLWNGREYMTEPCKPPLPIPKGEAVSMAAPITVMSALACRS